MTDNISDYGFTKTANSTSLNSASLTGFPTFIRLEQNGDTTGTGVPGLDTSANISGKKDIGFFDENDNLVDYYWVNFDTSNNVYEAWVLLDIIRDGGEDVKIGYGNGSTDDSVPETGLWDSVPDIVTRYGFEETSGDLIDSTSNSYDGSVSNVDQSVSDSPFGGGYRFNGGSASPRIDISGLDANDFTDEGTVLLMLKKDRTSHSSGSNTGIYSFEGSSSSNTHYIWTNNDAYFSTFRSNRVDNIGVDQSILDTWHVLTVQTNPSTWKLSQNKTEQYSTSGGSTVAMDLTVIGESSGSHYYEGLMSEMHIFSRDVSTEWRDSFVDMSSAGGYTLLNWNQSSITKAKMKLDKNGFLTT